MFDLNEIKRRASGQSYHLGELLYHARKVNRLVLTADSATATVAGSYNYQVNLQIGDTRKEGLASDETLQASCSCPAAVYQDICKHSIAVALLVEKGSKDELFNASAGVFDDKSTALKNWFKQKSSDDLTDIIMDYIGQSEGDEGKWELAMHNEQGSLSAAQISKLITKMLPAKQVWEWHKVDDYFQHANEMFDEVLIAIDKLSLGSQWKLILKLYQRLNKVLDNIDDSNGARFYIEGKLQVKITTLFNQLDWSDDKKAEWIFAHFETHQYDIFPSVPEDFDLSECVEALFCAACEAEVKKRILALLDRNDSKQQWPLKHFSEPLLKQAERQGDWQKQCQIMKRVAFEYSDYLEISELCLNNDDKLEAEYYLQQAYQQATSPYETRQCQAQDINVRIALNEGKQAWRISWQMFTDAPSFSGFKQLNQLEQQVGLIDPQFMQKAETVLAACYVESSAKNTFGSSRGLPANADAVLDFYLDQNELDKARKWVLTHQAHSVSLLKLAQLITISHPQASLDLYYRVVDGVINQANNRAYQEATDHLLVIEKQFIQHAQVLLYQMIAKIIKKQKAKRNLMTLFKTHFAQCFE